jgi:DNA-binding NarL/FixJ family response regulator
VLVQPEFIKERRCTAVIRTDIKNRRFSVVAFSFLFAYILTFVFEGKVLYSCLDLFGINPQPYVLVAMFSLLAGFWVCAFLAKNYFVARRILSGCISLSIVSTLPFFFEPTVLWFAGIVVAGFASGCALPAWIWTFRSFVSKRERTKTCVDLLIFSNLLMIIVNVSPLFFPLSTGLPISLTYLFLALFFAIKMPSNLNPSEEDVVRTVTTKTGYAELRMTLLLLFLFIAVITINSGLMYQIINPAFSHLTILVSWYWAVPYILMLLFIRNFPYRFISAPSLYIGAGMKIAAFVFFMFPGRDVFNYIIVDTLMLGACGIFDMFWWIIIVEMLEFSDNPAKVYSVGLTANVSGVLLGELVAAITNRISLSGAELTVIALLVMCAALIIYPFLARQLDLLAKTSKGPTDSDRTAISHRTDSRLENISATLTKREVEVLHLILGGKSNKEIADTLFLSESTVKTHAGNIYSKCEVTGRAELLSIFVDSELIL